MLPNRSTKPAPSEHNPYYTKYVSLVREGDILKTLDEQLDDSVSLLQSVSDEQADSRYAPDKWSIKEVLGHMLDSERVFSYRALRFARADQTPLSGYEQDDYVRAANFGRYQLGDLVEEFKNVRRATIYLFRGLDETAWMQRGIANDSEVTVRALAYIIAGHELHHAGIIRTKYLHS